MNSQKKKSKQSNKSINLNLLKNELVIARTSFEIAKKYKDLAQKIDDKNVDQKAILPFYIFASFAHLNHCLISIRKVLFDKESSATTSVSRHFDNGSLGETWKESKTKFFQLKKEYLNIKNDINEIVAHINKEQEQNSIFTISEEKFSKIEKLLNEISDLINIFPENEFGILPREHSALSNVVFGFDNLITVANKGIKNRKRRNCLKK